LLASLVWALRIFLNLSGHLPMEPWQRSGMLVLLLAGIAGFSIRTIVLWLRIMGPPPRD
jgi:hypothetical protein